MENASKALIIAGAILISILLISVGIIVMNSINKPLDQAQGQADSQAIEMFNAKFSGYSGNGKKAQDIKSLCSSIAASNGQDSSHQIKIIFKPSGSGATAAEKTPGALMSAAKATKSYNVETCYAKKVGTAIKVTAGGTDYTVTSEAGFIAAVYIEEK